MSTCYTLFDTIYFHIFCHKGHITLSRAWQLFEIESVGELSTAAASHNASTPHESQISSSLNSTTGSCFFFEKYNGLLGSMSQEIGVPATVIQWCIFWVVLLTWRATCNCTPHRTTDICGCIVKVCSGSRGLNPGNIGFDPGWSKVAISNNKSVVLHCV